MSKKEDVGKTVDLVLSGTDLECMFMSLETVEKALKDMRTRVEKKMQEAIDRELVHISSVKKKIEVPLLLSTLDGSGTVGFSSFVEEGR
jgi:chlorite dismutase